MKRFLALLLALSLCMGMLPMPGFAEEAAQEEAVEAVLEAESAEEAVETAGPTEPSEEVLEETFGETEAALPESGPALVITEQPEDTLIVEGVAYFAIAAQVELDGDVLEGVEVSCQWQKLEGDTWISLEGETGDILAVEAPEEGAAYRCLVTWEGLEAVSEAAAVIGEEAPPEIASAVWINPEYSDLFAAEDIPGPEFGFYGSTSGKQCTTDEEVIAALREGLVNRETTPSVVLETTRTFSTPEEQSAFLNNILTHLFDHTGKPNEGDYLRRDIGFCRIQYSGTGRYEGGTIVWSYTISLFDIEYFTNQSQEAAMDREVANVLASLVLDGKTDKQKVDAIYRYLIKNVKYVSDRELNDATNLIKYSSYAALVQKNTVCQGFAGAFYRLCLEEGIDSRVVSSEAMNHAWNIVKLGDLYYHLDATWDINWPNAPKYYLKGTASWKKEHKSSTTHYISELGDQFEDAAFASSYPVPEEDYREGTHYSITYQGVPEEVQNPNPLTGSTGTAVTLKDLTRPGYRFDGWFNGKEEKVTQIPAAQEEDVVLTARWSPITYTIRVEGNGLENNAIIRGVPYDMDYSLQIEADFRRPGYSLLGWNTKADGTGTAYALGQTVRNLCDAQDGVAVLYAQWEVKSYTVFFDANGGEGSVLDARVTYDQSLTLPDGKTLFYAGYSFVGWNTAPDGTGTNYTPGQTISGLTEEENLTLYAQWLEKGYEIFFDGNTTEELIGSMEALQAPWDVDVTLPECGYINGGFTFTGWNTLANGTGTMYQPGDTVRNLAEAGTVTLYAQWRANTYRAVFLPGGEDCMGTVEPMENLVNGKSYKIPQNGYSRPGYTFAGWYVEGWEDDLYKPGEAFSCRKVEQDYEFVFIAKWTPYTYTVRFNANKGTGKMPDQKGIAFDTATELQENTFTRKGYSFIGWNTKANGQGDWYEDGEAVLGLSTKNNAIVTLYAQWEGAPYELTFHQNFGEDETTTQTLYYGTAEALKQNAFTRPGYTFSGWNTKANGKGKKYSNGAKVTNLGGGLEEMDLYAQWTANKYTVEFHSNLAKDSIKKQTLTYDGKETALTANSFTWKGHAFQGWALSADGEVAFENKQPVQNLTEEKTIALYAVWKVNEYTVVFNSNGAGEEETRQSMTYDVAAELDKNTFTRPGYDFSGWATTAKGKAVHTDGKTVKNLTDKDNADIRLYAVWTPHSYTVEFDKGEGTVTGTMKPQKMTYGKAAALTNVSFKRTSYTFDGWQLEDEILPNRAKVTDLTTEGAVTLIARWVPTEYTIAYQGLTTAEREDLLTTYTVETEEMPGTPTRPGCEFQGWYLDAKFTKEFTGFENRTGTLKLYPKWVGTAYTYTVKFVSDAPDATGNMDKTAISAVSGKEYAPKTCAFKRNGYIFDGWRLLDGTVITTKEKFSNLALEDGAVVELTATWKPITYKVRFNANKGTGKMADQMGLVYDEPTALNANAFTRSGYTFAGWSRKTNGTDLITEAYNLTTKNNGTVTLYAQWTKNP